MTERRIDGESRFYLHLSEKPTPEVINALDEAIRKACRIADAAVT